MDQKIIKIYVKMDMKGSDFVGAGILCIIIGIIIILLYGDYKRIPNAKKTEANVCSVEWDKELDEGKKFFYANIQYFVEGKEYYIKTKDKKRYGYRNGKKIIVKYNKENPSQAIILHNLTDYIMPMFWIGFGIFAIISTVLNNQVNTNENNCCTCLDCPECDVCCDCNSPYLNK